MTMRWRSSGGDESTAAVEKDIDSSQACQATSASSSSTASFSPINDEPDSTSSTSSLVQAGITQSHSQQSQSTSSQLVSPDMVLGSSVDPGDPPYNSPITPNHSPHQHMGDDDDDGDEGGDQTELADSSSSSQTTKEPHKTIVTDDEEGSDQEIPWKPQATQSTCEFTHTITNYSQKRDSGCKKAEYSSTTIDEFGNRWRLIVYVNGNGRASNHHLSLFLQVADADDLPFGWKKAVSYVLTLEHPSGPNLSYAKRNPDKTFKLCPKAIDWGWSQFITSDRIQQEGFVQNDSLVVRASVTVKSSSVCIDLEDSELYLKCAVEEGKPEAVQLCLDQGASVNCQFKDDLYTPLHTACSSSSADDNGDGNPATNSVGSMQVLQLLLEKGADGNACNKWRETPLLIAANNGHRSAVEALLKHGADPSLCSEAGWSALTFAAHKGYDDIVALLLRAGAPVNCRVTEDSSTPLHKACAGSKTGHLTAVKLLLDNGADVHALNKWRETPLLTAANHGQAGAVEALLRAGADPCKCTDTGWSPLSIAAYKGHDDVVRLLLEEGAPTEEADPTLSALLQAATKGLPGTVELLLRHGADHTVTTKKGDTALSILVEQNLIDAAVEMVTEYKASIPRCSRDRKKVQRARLLINLRVKQQQREGLNVSTDDDDDEDETDQDNNLGVLPQHDDEKKVLKVPPKKKGKKKKMSAEEQAKAAEEALLLELEQEDAKRHKEEQEANKKSAKKRKKKERERQQKKEQEEKRLAEERKREETLRKEREAKEAAQRAERQQRLAAQKRKEEEEMRKRQQQMQQQQREQLQKAKLQQQQQQKEQSERNASIAASSSPGNDKRGKQGKGKPGKRQQGQASSRSSFPEQAPQKTAPVARAPTAQKNTSQAKTNMKLGSSSSSRSTGKNRGWETNPVVNNGGERKQSPPASTNTTMHQIQVNNPAVPASSAGSTNFISQGQKDKTVNVDFFTGAPKSSQTSYNSIGEIGSLLRPEQPQQSAYNQSSSIVNGLNSPSYLNMMEVPAVSLYRRDKVSELLQRCSVLRASSDSLSVVSELSIKKVLYRWMVRSAHESAPCLDSVIPSLVDFDELTTFFQRQFISESRRGMNASIPGNSMVSMEALKEAGCTMAMLCQSLGKDLAEFRRRIEEQLPPDWTDSSIGMSASDVMRNGHNPMVLLDWASRSQIYMPAQTVKVLRERFRGLPSRIMSALFVAKIRHDTKQLIVDGTSMDFSIPNDTLNILRMKASVGAEIWSDLFALSGSNVFWGQSSDIDPLFGGFPPFTKEGGSEEILLRHGGSVVVVPPLDNMVSSRYMRRMLDILELANQRNVPISFAVFLRAECFLDWNNSPTAGDLQMLDPRLRDSSYLQRVESLTAGQHAFFVNKSGGCEASMSGSLFITLQNELGRSTFEFRDQVIREIILSMGTNLQLQTETPQLMNPMSFGTSDFAASKESNVVSGVGYFESRQVSNSPISHQAVSSDFGTIGGTTISNAFSVPSTTGGPRRRGRLFDLVDDGEEDNLNDEIVSGMLGNLNVDLFQNPMGQDVDIEAISLMGIGGPPPSGGLQPRNSRRQFG